MSVIEKTVQKTTDLVDLALQIGFDESSRRVLWFRGHYSEQWALKSSLMRKVPSAELLFSTERRLITRFKQRSLPFWPAGYPQNQWEQLFAMQHYGVPTRLLDWSENLFVALYFSAVAGAYARPTPNEEESRPVIWILDPVGWNRGVRQLKDFADDIGILTTESEHIRPYEVGERDDLNRRYSQPVALYGTHNSARIVAQRGGFTICGKSLDSLDSFSEDVGDNLIWKVVLDYPRDQMRADLEVLGFAESMMFPDLVGLSREISTSEGLND